MATSQLGQLLLSGVPGPELDAQTAALFRKLQPGGFILFTRNMTSPAQLRKLLDDLRDLSHTPPILTIDQEGGRVSRLKVFGNEPPNARQLREKGEPELIRRHGKLTGQLLRLFGFNLDLCPVLDIAFDEDADNSLRGRCYGRDAQQVIALASLFHDAMVAEGILGCGKHFPGYSRAPVDAHHLLPEIPLSRAELEANELAVFRHFSSRVASMMTCHGLYPALDAERFPASLSHAIITGILRQEYAFEGLIMTDDLDMGAILNHYGLEETIRLALHAGNDLAMICHRPHVLEGAWKTLGSLPAPTLDRALENVSRFKSKMADPLPFSEAAFSALDAQVWQLRVETLGPERAQERSPEDGKRSPVETY